MSKALQRLRASALVNDTNAVDNVMQLLDRIDKLVGDNEMLRRKVRRMTAALIPLRRIYKPIKEFYDAVESSRALRRFIKNRT